MKLKLTDLTIRSLPVPEKGQAEYYDINHPGLCLRVSQGGSKIFTFRDRQNGSRSRITLGKYPNLSLSDARAACRQFAANPAMNKVTFGEAVASYLALATGHMSRSHIYELTRILTRTFQPVHAMPITLITPKHISDIIDAMPANALYTHGRVKTFMRWCRMRSLIQVNPIEFLPAPSKYVPRDRVLTDDELRRIWHAASQIGTFGFIIQLLISTGCRRNEIANLRREWIQEGLLIIPKEATKGNREHVIPLGQTAISILGSHLDSDSPTSSILLFPAPGKTSASFSAWSKSKCKLDNLSGVTDYVIHDLRRTFRTNLSAWKCCDSDTAKRLIGHKVGTEVSRIYNRYEYLEEKREAIERYTERLKLIIA